MRKIFPGTALRGGGPRGRFWGVRVEQVGAGKIGIWMDGKAELPFIGKKLLFYDGRGPLDAAQKEPGKQNCGSFDENG